MPTRRLKIRYARVEDGAVKHYAPGDPIDLTDEDAAQLGPDAVEDVNVDVNQNASDLIAEIADMDVVEASAVKIAEAGKEKPRTTVVSAAERRIEELEADKNGEDEED